jgi:hypothetical protein
MDVLVPGVTFLPGGIAADRRERDSGNAEGVIGKEIKALQCNGDPLGWRGRATTALGGGTFGLGSSRGGWGGSRLSVRGGGWRRWAVSRRGGFTGTFA